MADTNNTFAGKQLIINREAELLRSFVRVNVDDDEEDEKTAPQQTIGEQQPKEEKSAELDPNAKSSIQTPAAAGNVTQLLTQDVIKKKVKRRKKKNGNRHEELYCDKDRAAAANMGSKDIKQSLKLKRKQDRSQALQIPEEAEPGTFLALGNYEMCRGDLQIAIDFMTKALELNPAEKNALVARSKCYILQGQPENALKDAETALQIDKNFLKAIYQKAESLYYLGNFEHSLMYYHRGLHIRPDHEGFKLGVHKAQKAIENAIGSRSFPGLARFSQTATTPKQPTDNSFNSSALSTNSSSSSKSTTARESPTTVCNSNKTGVRLTPVTKVRSGRKSRLLRELGQDKEYLDNLIHNPNIKCKYKEDDCTIEKCIRETVEFLNARQEFWRQQLPPNLK